MNSDRTYEKFTRGSNNESKSFAIGTSAEYFGSCRKRDFDELIIFPFSSLKETAASRKVGSQEYKQCIKLLIEKFKQDVVELRSSNSNNFTQTR
jgi:hypothetical protein